MALNLASSGLVREGDRKMQKCLVLLRCAFYLSWWLQKQATAPSPQEYSLLDALCLLIHCSIFPSSTAQGTPTWSHHPWVLSGRSPGTFPSPHRRSCFLP